MFQRNKRVEPAPRLKIEPSLVEGGLAVVISGELDLSTGRDLLAFADLLVETKVVGFDLTGVYFIDSSGLNALLRAVQSLRQRGISAIVSRAGTQALKLFDVSGLREPLMADGTGALPTW